MVNFGLWGKVKENITGFVYSLLSSQRKKEDTDWVVKLYCTLQNQAIATRSKDLAVEKQKIGLHCLQGSLVSD